MLRAEREKYAKLILDADVVVVGSAPEELIRERIRQGKLIFRYSERPLKRGLELNKYPVRFIKWNLRSPFWKPIYMLCASAYTAGDYAKFGLFRNRCYKWGYFPETIQYDDLGKLIDRKEENSLIWVARYIDWKHPELAIEVVKRLKADGYKFTIRMIGNGELLEATQMLVQEKGLEQEIQILGAMKPEEVRRYMEQSQIHIFTSDKQEGWGAVLNEAMNSGCAPVANRQIGAAPFLIRDGENGFLYDSVDELYEKVKFLLDNRQERERMAANAYHTIIDEWNAETAAEKFLKLAEAILNGEKSPELFADGVCGIS
jgi:glycosyltransferase involved in cell wall biosynthesis